MNIFIHTEKKAYIYVYTRERFFRAWMLSAFQKEIIGHDTQFVGAAVCEKISCAKQHSPERWKKTHF